MVIYPSTKNIKAHTTFRRINISWKIKVGRKKKANLIKNQKGRIVCIIIKSEISTKNWWNKEKINVGSLFSIDEKIWTDSKRWKKDWAVEFICS